MLHLVALLLLTFAAARRIHPANNTDWCIHALAEVPRSGTQLGVERCTGSYRQEWNFFGSSSILQLRGTNLCAAPAAKRNGARVYLRDCPYDRGQWGEITWHPAGGLRLSYDNTSESGEGDARAARLARTWTADARLLPRQRGRPYRYPQPRAGTSGPGRADADLGLLRGRRAADLELYGRERPAPAVAAIAATPAESWSPWRPKFEQRAGLAV